MDNAATNVFAKRLCALIADSKKPMKIIAEEIGVSVGALSNYQNGRATASIDALRKIAQYFNVSADWLIGLSSAPSSQIDIQGIHQKTGLWEEAIISLEADYHMSDNDTVDFVSFLAINEKFSDLVKAIKQKNEFSEDPKTASIDIGGGYYEADMQDLFKMIVSDLFFEIIAGYTAKPGEIMLGYKVGGNNG